MHAGRRAARTTWRPRCCRRRSALATFAEHVRSFCVFARKPQPATILSLIAAVFAAGGASYAVANPGSSGGGVLHACVNRRTGVLRLVRSAANCHRARHGRPGERPVEWGRIGPVGPSDGYFSRGAAGQRPGFAIVNVPPGQYIASGGCDGSRQQSDPNEPSASFGEIKGSLTSSPPPGNLYGAPDYLAWASVPDRGENGISAAPPGSGSATLSNAGAFSMATHGQIMEICEPAPTSQGRYGTSAEVEITGQWVYAIRVGSLHVQ